ncbi:SMP-30/gluconolactonase/LRE family protein [Aureimonas pseudogalii]|uniref:Sugar lactone lactonase YvrE n=1 Tax=Aureimonas pseudogalii TaxID=1744844 RepID=A0A7W6H9A3_9HYPH|nr:SMP-30/gluconolactonase/LRE family protein [Aureimonas pseudogalii]MBB4000862.1 sugar lactone lactonase YvrE [Aureimonas pseudogalii]
MTVDPERLCPLDAARCEIAEGTTYDAHADVAWWFDIPAWRLFEHRFVTGETIVHDLPFYASALARIDGERQLLATEAGLRDIGLPTGQVTCPPFVGKDASTLLVTTSFAGYDGNRRKAEPDAGATFLGNVGAASRFDPDVLIA